MNRMVILTAISCFYCTPVIADENADRVDKLFAKWNRKDSPGCTVAVMKDGKIVYKRGFGLADLEFGIPNSPSTIFHIASISKQFTAFSILLLERDGKLSLDDDVHRYLPELHDFGKRITIRNLLQHTSGLRDQWSLLTLGGWRMEDVITEGDILGLVWRQTELNFEPGAEFNYCNTGYTLSAKIVERVSGKPLKDFAEQRIFNPLGMKKTHFHSDEDEIVKNRAYSYEPDGERSFKNHILSYGNVGATSLFTTVEDLARWDQNFYEPRVGDKNLVARLQETGKLNDGKPMEYALGLAIRDYRGLRTVEHGGADAGFRSDLLRFPSESFSVIILANVGDFVPESMARKVADIYLADKLKPTKTSSAGGMAAGRKEVNVDSKTLDAYVGEYRLFPGMSVVISKENDRLMVQATGQPKSELFASSDTEFFVKVVDAQITFDKPTNGQCGKLTVHMDGQNMPGPRFVRPALDAQKAAELAGDYYSDELGVIYSISCTDGKLRIRHPRGEVELKHADTDAFEAPYPISEIKFSRTGTGKIKGFALNQGRVRNLKFARVEIIPVN